MRNKIMIVEDDSDILLALDIMLTNSGYDVTAVPSGKTIVDGQAETPDLFILDKRMPDMDGLDLCRYLRSSEPTKNTPVIIISASPKFGPASIAAGASDFLAKPFDLHDLLRVVRKYLPL
jgi:CheY-like chemotaxis protein